MTAIIRQANEEDATAIEQLLLQLINDPLVSVSPQRLKAIRASDDNFVLVIELDSKIVALSQITLCPDIMFGLQPFAQNIRRQGIGKLLMKAIDEKCLQHDCSKSMFLSAKHRTESHAFFEANGYSSDVKKGFIKYRSSMI
jgi:N-acetylglutamate synthase-like GNAT family acetyltransferase